ncbi:hypothetical protein QZH41_019858, partial [Actinostola sp. cb2023]
VHITTSSQVPDHCSQFALSDSSETSFTVKCSHTRDMRCKRCDDLKAVLSDIETAITATDFQSVSDKDDTLFACQEDKACIQNWKSHLLRIVNQDRARIDVIERLEEDSALLVQDWAMKCLPRQYRESQGEWFAKRPVLAYHRGNHQEGELLTDTLPIVSNRIGVRVERMAFSDPQGGRGPCDRPAATLKNHVRAYTNEGHNVCSVQELKHALLSYGGIPGVGVAMLTNPHASK